MNIAQFDNLIRYEVAVAAGGRCEVCGHPGCQDHHVISRGHWLTRWAWFNHIWCCPTCHEQPHAIRAWLEMEHPRVWAIIRRCEIRMARGRYSDRNMSPDRIRARIAMYAERKERASICV